MGYIISGDTMQLTAYLTQKGRELLLNGAEADITATYFALGDSDTNYKVQFPLGQGFVPDLTGDNTDCILSLANNIGIKYALPYNTNVQPPTPQSQVMFKRTDDGQYYNVLNCLIHLDSIGRYQLYHSSGNKSNPNRLKLNNALASPMQDLFLESAIVTNPKLVPLSTDFAAPDNMVFEMLFDPSIYKKLNNTYLDGSASSTVTQTGGGKSPIALTFSSQSGKYGQGRASVGLYNRELGYAYRAETDTTWSFASAANTENVKNYVFYTDGNNTILNKYAAYTLAARIDSKDQTTGVIRSFIYRGDQNLGNITDGAMASYSNETRFANQYAKLFATDFPIVDGSESSAVTEGLMQKEITNLVDFVQTSGLFTQTSGTNEYRTSKLSFSVYPKTPTPNCTPATLNLIFSFNDDILLNGDANTSAISDEGDKVFIQYDFTATNGVFKNKIKTGVFARNNCATGSNGSSVTYTVPAATYTGSTQSAADTLAQNDVDTNGQTYANTQGTCTVTQQYSSAIYSQFVYRNNCGANYSGGGVYVNFPAGQFHSYISQLDADQQASTAAQLQANSQGTCTYNQPSTGGGGGGGCLLPGQLVFTSPTETKLIEAFQIGDTVYTFHETTQKLDTYTVSRVYARDVDHWYEFTTVYGKKIKCSPTHLFMVGGVKRVASELTTEDFLQYNVNGRLYQEKIQKIDVINEPVTVYNIEVEDAHTYITENGIWQHNLKAVNPDFAGGTTQNLS